MMRAPHRIEMEDFKRILNEEIEIYGEIQRILEEKKQSIIQGNLDELIKIDASLEKHTLHTRELEQKRLALLVKMGCEGETLREFIETLETGEDAKVLGQAREKLLKATQEIKQLSHVNRDLLTQSIRMIEQSVDFIASILSPEGASYKNPKLKRNAQDGQSEKEFGSYSSTICRDV